MKLKNGNYGIWVNNREAEREKKKKKKKTSYKNTCKFSTMNHVLEEAENDNWRRKVK